MTKVKASVVLGQDNQQQNILHNAMSIDIGAAS